MKKLAYSIFLVTLVVGLARMVSFITVKPLNKFETWTTFQKHPHHPNIVRSHTSTVEEKKQVNIAAEPKSKKRSPASNGPTQEKMKYLDREVLNFIDQDANKVANLEQINEVSDDWKSKAAGKLLRFQDPSTKLLIMPQKSVAKVEEQGVRLAEVVSVRFLTKDGKKTSYSALIDSQSGEVIRSWNQTIVDAPYESKQKVKLTNTGSL